MGDRETAPDAVRQVTYLFTDIEGSTRLWSEHPEAMAGALDLHFEVLRAAVVGAGGEVVQDTGDGIFAVFPTAATAVDGAISMQRGLRDATWPGTGQLLVRIGLHTGTVDPNLRDYRGPSVNRAARVMDVAHGGQIVMSGPTRELLADSPLTGLALDDLGVHALRGIATAEHLWQVSAPDLPTDFPPPRVKGGAVSAVCPYKGLAAFQPEDAELFFGREELVDRLVARLAASRFLGVVGPSGSGKSSVARAGLLPALARGALPGSAGWVPLVLTPTADPVTELAHRLTVSTSAGMAQAVADLRVEPRSIDALVQLLLEQARPDAQLLLVVDQFEEIFTLCRDEEQRAQFVRLVVRLARAEGLRSRVVLVIRSDHYGACGAFPELAAELSDSQVLVGAMQESELRRAVVAPAEAVGLELERELADAVVADAGGGIGSLPLMSHALVETWSRRSATTLTLDGYRQAGGVNGAIARTAESLYRDRLDAEQREIARLIFLRLVEPGDGGADSKRRAHREELVPAGGDPEVVQEVLDHIIAARLVTAQESTVELAHEALLREWPTLRRWLDDSRDGLRLLRHVAEAARAWEDMERDPGELYRGARLAAVEEWLEEGDVDLNPSEQAFVDASMLLADDERHAAIEQAEKQARQNRRLRVLLVGAAGLLVVALAAGTLAALQWRRATDAVGLASARAMLAEASAVGLTDADLGLLLAVESTRLGADDAAARRVLVESFERWPNLRRMLRLPPSIALSFDGGRVLSAGFDEAIIRELATGDEVLRVPAAGEGAVLLSRGHLLEVTESADGVRASASDVASGATVFDEVVAGPQDAVRFFMDASLLPDGEGALVTLTDESVRGSRTFLVGPGGSRPAFAARDADACVVRRSSISAAGAVAVASYCGVDLYAGVDRTAPTWSTSLEDGDGILPFVEGMVFADDGAALVVQTETGHVVLDAASGAVRHRFDAPGGMAGSQSDLLAAPESGAEVLVVEALGQIAVLDVRTGALATLPDVAPFPSALGADKDSWYLAFDVERVQVVDRSGSTRDGPFVPLLDGPGHLAGTLDVAYRIPAFDDPDPGPTEAVDTATGRVLGSLEPFDDNGLRQIVSGSPTGDTVIVVVMRWIDDVTVELQLELRDGRSLELVAMLDVDAMGPGTSIVNQAFIPSPRVAWAEDGATVVVGIGDASGQSGSIGRFDVATGAMVAGPITPKSWYGTMRWSDDRQELYLETDSGTAVLDGQLVPTGRVLPVYGELLGLADDAGILIAGGFGPVEFLSVDDGELLATHRGLQGGVMAAGVTPDGSVAAFAGVTGELLLLDPATGAEVAPVFALDTIGADAGDRDRGLSSLSPLDSALPVSHDGQRFGVVTPTGIPVVIDLAELTLDGLTERACRVAGRNLTWEEWERHLPAGEEYRATCPEWPRA